MHEHAVQPSVSLWHQNEPSADCRQINCCSRQASWNIQKLLYACATGPHNSETRHDQCRRSCCSLHGSGAMPVGWGPAGTSSEARNACAECVELELNEDVAGVSIIRRRALHSRNCKSPRTGVSPVLACTACMGGMPELTLRAATQRASHLSGSLLSTQISSPHAGRFQAPLIATRERQCGGG